MIIIIIIKIIIYIYTYNPIINADVFVHVFSLICWTVGLLICMFFNSTWVYAATSARHAVHPPLPRWIPKDRLQTCGRCVQSGALSRIVGKQGDSRSDSCGSTSLFLGFRQNQFGNFRKLISHIVSCESPLLFLDWWNSDFSKAIMVAFGGGDIF